MKFLCCFFNPITIYTNPEFCLPSLKSTWDLVHPGKNRKLEKTWFGCLEDKKWLANQGESKPWIGALSSDIYILFLTFQKHENINFHKSSYIHCQKMQCFSLNNPTVILVLQARFPPPFSLRSTSVCVCDVSLWWRQLVWVWSLFYWCQPHGLTIITRKHKSEHNHNKRLFPRLFQAKPCFYRSIQC